MDMELDTVEMELRGMFPLEGNYKLREGVGSAMEQLRYVVDIQSAAPPERILDLMTTADQHCFAINSLRVPTRVHPMLRLNGELTPFGKHRLAASDSPFADTPSMLDATEAERARPLIDLPRLREEYEQARRTAPMRPGGPKIMIRPRIRLISDYLKEGRVAQFSILSDEQPPRGSGLHPGPLSTYIPAMGF